MRGEEARGRGVRVGSNARVFPLSLLATLDSASASLTVHSSKLLSTRLRRVHELSRHPLCACAAFPTRSRTSSPLRAGTVARC